MHLCSEICMMNVHVFQTGIDISHFVFTDVNISVQVYRYIHIYIYIHILQCIFTYTYTYTYTYYTYTHNIYIYIYYTLYMYIYIYMDNYKPYLHTIIHMYVYVYPCMDLHHLRNYRRLLGDLHWPYSTDFDDFARSWWKGAGLICLRRGRRGM